ncbi:hypothetical protein MAP00_006209 [Monascus purpureus]|nr:hypothetical protein MAP00_006209 [Monascus purpureus]
MNALRQQVREQQETFENIQQEQPDHEHLALREIDSVPDRAQYAGDTQEAEQVPEADEATQSLIRNIIALITCLERPVGLDWPSHGGSSFRVAFPKLNRKLVGVLERPDALLLYLDGVVR